MRSQLFSLLLSALASTALAAPLDEGSLVVRQAATEIFVTPATSPTTTDPHQQFEAGAISNVTCNGAASISLANQDIAELAVCGGIKAPIDFCPGNLKTTTGVSGNAKWTITAATDTTLGFFKGNWEECCNAARATCPGQTFTARCELGTAAEGPGFTFDLSVA
ncbi:hypothetical protein GQ53DRAFT_829353 [Thozetella sp. PMI_491]|nr:hypothetical protein GQ53DRAFT_829353 [Thozetella sp. PMI_491]